MSNIIHDLRETISSVFSSGRLVTTLGHWANTGTYPPRLGNEIQILIDGQAAYRQRIHLRDHLVWRSGLPLGSRNWRNNVRHFQVASKGRC